MTLTQFVEKYDRDGVIVVFGSGYAVAYTVPDFDELDRIESDEADTFAFRILRDKVMQAISVSGSKLGEGYLSGGEHV